MRIRWTEQAVHDLTQICDHLEEHDSAVTAAVGSFCLFAVSLCSGSPANLGKGKIFAFVASQRSLQSFGAGLNAQCHVIAFDLVLQSISRLDLERITDFARDCGLTFASHRGMRHSYSLPNIFSLLIYFALLAGIRKV